VYTRCFSTLLLYLPIPPKPPFGDAKSFQQAVLIPPIDSDAFLLHSLTQRSRRRRLGKAGFFLDPTSSRAAPGKGASRQ
jgi:hypothetical protein